MNPTPAKTSLTHDAVRRLLSDLLGRPVTFARSPAFVPKPQDRIVAAVYAKQDGAVAVVALADIAFTVFAGASLTMFPAPMAERQIETNQIDDMVFENFREIMNVCATLFNESKSAHARLTALHRLPSSELPPDLAARITQSGSRLDGTAAFPNYGSGRLSFLFL